MQSKASLWDQRYQDEQYFYGTQANDFLRQQALKIQGKNVLCIAEGEGRNAVFLAGLGYQVTAIDISARGVEKTRQLAARHNVAVTAIEADLEQWQWPQQAFDGIVAIFAHFPSAARRQIHASVEQALTSGGTLILEAYTPEQLRYGTGGPPKADMMMSEQTLADEFANLSFSLLQTLERQVREGQGHTGLASVVQAVAVKP